MTNCAISISPKDGSIAIAGFSSRLFAGMPKSETPLGLENHRTGRPTKFAGYEWNLFSGFSFGGYPCSISLCFRGSSLAKVVWHITLPEERTDSDSYSREIIRREIATLREILSEQLGVEMLRARSRSSGELFGALSTQRTLAALPGSAMRHNKSLHLTRGALSGRGHR